MRPTLHYLASLRDGQFVIPAKAGISRKNLNSLIILMISVMRGLLYTDLTFLLDLRLRGGDEVHARWPLPIQMLLCIIL